MSAAVLGVRELSVSLQDGARSATVVDGVSFDLFAGEVLALVGESGCGKSKTAEALMGLIPANLGCVRAARLQLGVKDLLALPETALRGMRGRDISMVFQEPLTALDPVFRAGEQLETIFRRHRGYSRAQARRAAIDMLGQVGFGDAELILRSYPHELSGGMRQRVLIAMALACEPDVVIADEPTTAVDATIQAQILALIRRLQRERQMALLFISHDLALVERIADAVAVMYAGRIVETASVVEITRQPRHPYSRALWAANPAVARPGERLRAIGGAVPDLHAPPRGCAFYDRCPRRERCCAEVRPVLESGVACFFPHDEPLHLEDA